MGGAVKNRLGSGASNLAETQRELRPDNNCQGLRPLIMVTLGQPKNYTGRAGWSNSATEYIDDGIHSGDNHA